MFILCSRYIHAICRFFTFFDYFLTFVFNSHFFLFFLFFFFSSRRRHTRCLSDWSSDVCSSDLQLGGQTIPFNLNTFDLGVGFNPALQDPSIAPTGVPGATSLAAQNPNLVRSEERRVGKECRSRWSPYN